jgi:hypothetical protein
MIRRALGVLAVAGLLAGGLAVTTAAPAGAATDMNAAVAQASAYAESRGETVGISVFDRDTGQYYENGQLAHTQMRSASIPKILVAESLLDRSRRGEITLTQADRDLMLSMVARSDDAAMSNLYSRFGGLAMVTQVLGEYGLTEIGPPPTPSYWGMYQITAHDIASFYRQVIESTHLQTADRDQLIAMMRAATQYGADGFDQYFGIPYALPYQYWGVKQGWMCCQEGLRRLHTSGILGQDARYAVAVLSQMPQARSYAYAAQTLTAVVQTLYPGGTIPFSERARVPFGSIDVVREQSPGRFRFTGWTADPDDPTRSIDVHIYVDGALAAYGTAGGSRPDVGAALPGYGGAHGYTLDVPVADGRHSVCVYAINVGPGTGNPSLGCVPVEAHLSPIGNFEAATAVGLRGMRVLGWTLDLEAPGSSTDVVLSVDGQPVRTIRADGTRNDVGGVFAGAGAAHGFTATLGMAWPGRHQVCATAVNVGGTGGANTPLGCRFVDGPTGIVGNLDGAAPGSGTVRVTGWAMDSMAPSAATQIHVYVDGRYAGATSASVSRPDVGAAYPEGGAAHGFDTSVAATSGRHNVCAYALYADGRALNPVLGCSTVVVP